MNKKEIAILALRITSLYFAILTLAQITPFLSSLPFLFPSDYSADSTDLGTKTFLFSGILSLLVYFLAAGGLWRYAPKLADLILPGPPGQSPEPREMDLHSIEVFCISLLGLFILASAVPSLARIVFAAVWPQLDTAYNLTSTFAGERKVLIPYSEIISLVVKLAIGFWFTIGSAGILGLIKRVRELGRPTA